MSALQWFWIPHGWFTEALASGQRAVEQAENLASDYERAVIHDVVGWVKIFAGDYAGALANCRQSLELFSKLDNQSDIARTKMTLGITGAVTGQIENGPELIMEALSMYEALEDSRGTALAFTALGEGARAAGDRGTAEQCYQSALALVVESGNVYWQGGLLNNLTHFRLHEGNWQEALEMASEALKLGEEYGYPMVVNLAIAALGGVAVTRGDAKLAAQLFGVTDKLLTELGAVFEPLDLVELEKNTASAKALLSPQEYAAAFAEGQSWTLDKTITAALDQV
jgi:tetratricopeptide (TPR) repeat protein